ncbi:hypothetical protein KI387_034807 [Taxus chinensis]|uniref:Pentatricopeptide repeat-containing protein n=1 Tax=Taxus chinensis TaxID=29808 RepID=A0AA38BXK5_TAXCH|nr:hypothetical protein KI387_034807 [Taxus chinensis]
MSDELKLEIQDCTAVMNGCIRLEMYEAVESLFAWWKQSGHRPNVVMYTTLMQSRYCSGKFREAFALVWEMEESNCLPDLPADCVPSWLYGIQTEEHSDSEMSGMFDEEGIQAEEYTDYEMSGTSDQEDVNHISEGDSIEKNAGEWSADELDAIASLFRGSTPKTSRSQMKERCLPLPMPHKIRTIGVPQSKRAFRSPNSSNRLYKTPEFLITLAREIRQLPPEEEVAKEYPQIYCQRVYQSRPVQASQRGFTGCKGFMFKLDDGIHAKFIVQAAKSRRWHNLAGKLIEELMTRDKLYIRLGMYEAVESLFAWWKQSGHRPNVVMYTTLMQSRYCSGKFREAFALVWEMEESNRLLNLPAYRVIIRLCAKLGDLTGAARYFYKLRDAAFVPTHDIYSHLIGLYSESGRLVKCRELLKEMEMMGINPNLEIRQMFEGLRENENSLPYECFKQCTFYTEVPYIKAFAWISI